MERAWREVRYGKVIQVCWTIENEHHGQIRAQRLKCETSLGKPYRMLRDPAGSNRQCSRLPFSLPGDE